MEFIPFYAYFPKIAEAETREITITEDINSLPMGSYGLLDSYCNDPGCDCRKVIFHVVSSRARKIVAVIDYGWEEAKFYEKWFGENDKNIIAEMKGPGLNILAEQSKYASELLNMVKVVIKDSAYVERIKRHYKMFKQKIDSDNETLALKNIAIQKIREVGRNNICPCGSGKKHKRCCGSE